MWTVESTFTADDDAPRQERVLSCGESYKIGRAQPGGGRELYFDLGSIRTVSREHAFIEIDAAPQGKWLERLKADWRPRIFIRPALAGEGSANERPRPVFVRRRRAMGAGGAGDADDSPAAAVDAGDAATEDTRVKAAEPYELHDGDMVYFGGNRDDPIATLYVKWVPLSFCVAATYRTDAKWKASWKNMEETISEAASMGIPIVFSPGWEKGATHLVVRRVALRPNVIEALHASVLIVQASFVDAVVHAAVNAEKEPSPITPVVKAIDPAEHVPGMPGVLNDDGSGEVAAELRKAMLPRAREKPLLGRTVLLFTSEPADDQTRSESENIDGVLAIMGAKVVMHDLTQSPLPDAAAAKAIIEKAIVTASKHAATSPAEIRRHVGGKQSLIIYYKGDRATLPFVSAFASKEQIPMPKVTEGELDWIAYGVRTYETLLRLYTGNIRDYIESDEPSQAQPEGEGAQRAGEPEPNAHANPRQAAAALPQPEPAAPSRPEPAQPADENARMQGQQGANAAAAAIPLRKIGQHAEQMRQQLDSIDFGDFAPAAPSKSAKRKRAQKAQDLADAGPSATRTGESRDGGQTEKSTSGNVVDAAFDELFGGGSTNVGTRVSGARGSSSKSARNKEQESMTRQLRAFAEEDGRTQAALAARREAAGDSVMVPDSLITQAILEEDEGVQSQEPMSPLVIMNGSEAIGSQASSTRARRKRTPTPSPERDARPDKRASKRQKRAEENEKDGPGSNNKEGETAAPAASQEPSQVPQTSKGRIVRGHKGKSTGKEPDKDEGFLRAVSTVQRRKKVDEFDQEFNQLNLVKPVHGKAGARGKGQKAAGGGREADDDERSEEQKRLEEEFQVFREMADEELDFNVRGNFLQVDFVPLVVRHAELQPQQFASDGRPNFKAFRRKGQAGRAFEPSRVVPTVLDALPQLQIGDEPKRTTYTGADDEDLLEDDADFAGLHATGRTVAGRRGKTTSKFQFSLGDDDLTQRGRATAQQPESTGAQRGRGTQSQATRGRGRGRGAVEYVEVEDDEDSDPEAGLLLDLDEEDDLLDELQDDTQFSVLSEQTPIPKGRKGTKATTAATRAKAASNQKPDSGPSVGSSRSKGAGSSGGGQSSETRYATASNQSSQLFRGLDDSLDPLAEEGSSLGPTASASRRGGRGASATPSTTVPSGSVVPASRPMESHDEDTFAGFGMSGKRKRGAGAGTSSSLRTKGGPPLSTAGSSGAATRRRTKF